jgi:Zn-dependent protease
LSLGRPFGIPVFLGYSSIMLLVIVAVIGKDRAPAPYGTPLISPMTYGILLAVGLLLSLLLHELFHCIAARRFRIPVVRIQFEGFGGNSQFEKAADTPAAEAVISAAGPFANFLLWGALTLGAHQVTHRHVPGFFLTDLAFTNAALGIFNLLPGLPLDGGRIVQAGMWKLLSDRARATRAAAYSGMGVAVLFAGYAFARASSDQGITLYSLLISFTLFQGARQSLMSANVGMAITTLRARDFVRPTFFGTADLPLSEALRRAHEESKTAIAVIDADGEPTALIVPHAVASVPEQRRPWITLGEVSRSLQQEDIIDVELEGDDLLASLRATDTTEHLVIDADGSPLGVLSTMDVAARLSAR